MLLDSRGGGQSGDLMVCRVPLLAALHRDQVPGYQYSASEDCHFWAHFAARDRTVEGSAALDFNRLAALRLSEPFDPPLRSNGTALYIGAHRGGEDGVVFHQRHGLRMHLFEPSPTFFRALREALAGLPGMTLHNFGLGSRTRWAPFHLSGTASRAVSGAGGPGEDSDGAAAAREGDESVLIRAAAEAIRDVLPSIPASAAAADAAPAAVELVHVNCEGCEYDVVEGLRAAGVLGSVEQIQIATHLLDYVQPTSSFQETVEFSLQLSAKRYCQMHEVLSETHDRVWGLPWVWERWTRKA